MTETATAQPLSTEEQEQIRQTIEMFEVITQANPQDTQSLEILKEAYAKLGQQKDSLAVGRKLADTYMELGQYSSALLEYEGILQKEPDNAEIIAALGEVEQRLQALQQTVQVSASVGSAAASGINLDFKSVVTNDGNLITTKKTQSDKPLALAGGDTAAVAARLATADDGNDALVKFLLHHRLAPEDIITQSLHATRKKSADRPPGSVAASLLDEIVTRGGVEPETLLCGILDRSKFAYIPIENYDIDRQIVRMLPDALTLGRIIVPFDIISRTMMVAIANPFDAAGKEAVQQLVDYNIQWHLAAPSALIKVLQNVYRLD